MKLPIHSEAPAGIRFLEFDRESEMVFLDDAEGRRLHGVAWASLIRLIEVEGGKGDGAESRRVPRAALALQVTYRAPDVRERVTVTRDVGAGGMFIETATPLPRGKEIEVEFALPDPPFDRVRAKGRVAWTQAAAERLVFPPGMGLQFTEITPELQGDIAQLVTRLNDTRRAA